MTILDRIRSWSSAKPGKTWRRRMSGRLLESGQTTRVNEKGWAGASNADIDSEVLPSLETIRSRCKNLVFKNGFARGIVQTYGHDLWGRSGPSLQIQSDSEFFNERLEDVWFDWCEVADARGKQHFADMMTTLFRALWTDGEFFIQKVTPDQPRGAIHLRLQPIDPARIDTPIDMITDPRVVAGIETNTEGVVVAYHVRKTHPGRSVGVVSGSEDYNRVLAGDMIHCFQADEPGQTRGVPWYQPVQETFGQLHEFIDSTLLAARVASMFAAFMKTNHPDAQFESAAEGEIEFSIRSGTVTMAPNHWDIEQIKPEHPATTFIEFTKFLLSMVGRPVGMPYLRVAADASGHNFSSARLDLQTYWAGIQATQGWIERSCLNLLVREVASEMLLPSEQGKPDRWSIGWTWTQIPHVDPLKEANAATQRLRNGTSTLRRERMVLGQDPDEVQAQRDRETEELDALDLRPGMTDTTDTTDEEVDDVQSPQTQTA
jgi:lambda family phage portal protein